jgi:hypothetical protein
MNFRPGSRELGLLAERGWQLIAVQDYWRIDQVWLDPGTAYSTLDWWQGLTLPRHISDHLPIGVRVSFSVPRQTSQAANNSRQVVATVMQHACALPRANAGP